MCCLLCRLHYLALHCIYLAIVSNSKFQWKLQLGDRYNDTSQLACILSQSQLKWIASLNAEDNKCGSTTGRTCYWDCCTWAPKLLLNLANCRDDVQRTTSVTIARSDCWNAVAFEIRPGISYMYHDGMSHYMYCVYLYGCGPAIWIKVFWFIEYNRPLVSQVRLPKTIAATPSTELKNLSNLYIMMNSNALES